MQWQGQNVKQQIHLLNTLRLESLYLSYGLVHDSECRYHHLPVHPRQPAHRLLGPPPEPPSFNSPVFGNGPKTNRVTGGFRFPQRQRRFPGEGSRPGNAAEGLPFLPPRRRQGWQGRPVGCGPGGPGRRAEPPPEKVSYPALSAPAWAARHAGGASSFLSFAEQYFIVWIYFILFIHSTIDGHLGFHLWPLWIMLLWTFMYKFLCGHGFSFLLDIYKHRSRIVGSHGNSVFDHLMNCQNVF